jgi:hypothetical protein
MTAGRAGSGLPARCTEDIGSYNIRNIRDREVMPMQ